MTTTNIPRTIHEGRNVKRIREILGIKQEALAADLGLNQQRISLLEQKEVIDAELLEDVAKALKVPVDAIKNFNEEAAINIVGNTVTNHDNGAVFNYFPVFNPIDKWVEALEENKKLYERLLESEKEKVVLLQQLLNKDGK